MKKYFIVSVLTVGLLLAGIGAVFAQDLLSQEIATKAYGTGVGNNLSETIGKIIKVILGFLGTIFLGLTVYAGFLYMTAGGTEEKLTKAVGILKMAVIGLIIVLASYSIAYFVLDKIFEATL